jgi:hypothetical protein
MIGALLALLGQAKGSPAQVQVLALSGGASADAAWVADLDGDGTRELVVASHGSAPRPTRQLQLFRAARGAPALAPWETLPLPPDVAAFAVGDVREGGGEEIVLFNAGGAYSWRPSGPPEERLEKIAEADFLWQAPDPGQVHDWREGVRDLDGDGLADLVLPEPGGILALLQRRPREAGGPWGERARMRVPDEPGDEGLWVSATGRGGASVRGRRTRRDLALEIGVREGDDESAGVLVSVTESVPAPQWLDWDGDGDLDLWLQGSRHLHVWRQDRGDGFGEAPALSLELPVEVDQARRLDASYSSHAVDLDRDARADCVIFAGDKRSESVRTQGLFFTQAGGVSGDGPPLFGAAGRPRDVLVFAGFVSDPTFRDLDGDGYPELVLRSVRPDLIDQIRSASSESIDADLFVYRNRRGVLSRQPDLVWRHSIPLQRFQLTAEFGGDLTGDGLSELFVRDRPDRLRVLLCQARGPREAALWQLHERPLWELAIPKQASVALMEPARGRGAELVVLEEGQVTYVSFP